MKTLRPLSDLSSPDLGSGSGVAGRDDLARTGSHALDEQARVIARQVECGEMGEDEGTRRLGELAIQTAIPEVVARRNLRRHSSSSGLRGNVAEIADLTSGTIFRRITGVSIDEASGGADEPVGGASDGVVAERFVDVRQFTEASFSGWMFQLSKKITPSSVRDHWRRNGRNFTPVSPLPPEPGAHLGGDEHAYHAAKDGEGRDLTLEVRSQNASGWIASQSRHLRGVRAVASRAASIRYTLGLPGMCRPDWEERQEMLGAGITAQEALSSAYGALKIREGEAPGQGVNAGLLALWDNFDAGDLASVTKMPGMVALELVHSALMDRPKHRSTVAELKRQIRSRGKGPGWRSVSSELTELVLAMEFEASSPFDTRASEEEVQQREQGRVTTYSRRVQTLMASVGLDEAGMPTLRPQFVHSLGASPAAVMESLLEIVESVSDMVAEVGQWSTAGE